MASKERVDTILVQRGYFDSREKAKRAVMAGLVFSEGQRIDKPGTKVGHDLPLEVKGALIPYVSRGGLKLKKAIDSFQLSLEGKTVIDIGASTGGFTDCALQHGAAQVYAVDVGYGQLDWKLRSDPRVILMERTNFRYAKVEDFQHGLPDFASIDVSFISLKLIFPALYPILQSGGEGVALVKPQFEAGRDRVGKKGVVRDALVHEDVLLKTVYAAREVGLQTKGLDYSPITGGEGNIEFLLYFSKEPGEHEAQPGDNRLAETIKAVVWQAHQHFQADSD